MAAQNDAWLTLWIDGEPYEDTVSRVLELEVDERTDEASSFRLSLDMASDQGDWDLLADGRFALLHQIGIEIGIGPLGAAAPSDRAFVFQGYVTAVEPRFGEKRIPDTSLELFGLDASCLMHFEERCRAWPDTTDADIVKTIYQSYGFSVDVTPTTTPRTSVRGPLVQRGTDAEFVRMLARRNGVEAYVERTSDPPVKGSASGPEVVGHFHLPRLDATTQPVLELVPRATPSLTELRVRWDSHRPAAVLGAHIDERTRRLNTTRMDTPRYQRLGSTSRADILAQRLPAILPSQPTATSVGLQFVDVPWAQQDVEDLAWADFREADWLAEAEGVVMGLRYPTVLRARRPVSLSGAGRLLDGVWYVRRASHKWVRDVATKRYEVTVDLARNALNGVA